MESAPATSTAAAARYPEAWALVIILCLLTIDAFAGFGGAVSWLCALFLGVCAWRRAWHLLPSALLLFFLFVAGRFLPSAVWRFPAAGFLIPFALTALTALPFATLREQFRWLRRGHLDQVTVFLVVITSLVSALVLVLWALWTDYLGLGAAMLGSMRSVPRWVLLFLGIPGFALMNAFAEEVVYRGVFFESLRRSFPTRLGLVLAVQASAFAAAHYVAGFPNGKLGYGMTFIYAYALGYLRLRSEGMLAPYLAHVAADVVIGLTLLLLT